MEMKAIVESLRSLLVQIRSTFLRIIIESDSSEAVSILNREVVGFSEVRNLRTKLKRW